MYENNIFITHWQKAGTREQSARDKCSAWTTGYEHRRAAETMGKHYGLNTRAETRHRKGDRHIHSLDTFGKHGRKHTGIQDTEPQHKRGTKEGQEIQTMTIMSPQKSHAHECVTK